MLNLLHLATIGAIAHASSHTLVSGPEPHATSIDLSSFSVPATTVLATLHRVSLDPGGVAAAGVSLNDSIVMLTAAAAAIEEHAAALAAADESLGVSRRSVDALERSVRPGFASDTEAAVAALATARATLATATTARDAVLATIIEGTVVSLTNAQRSSLASVRASAADWSELPAAYRVIASDDDALLELREALAAKRISLAEGEAVPDDAAAILSQWSQSQAVAAALAAHDANAAMIAASWATAVVQPPE